MLQFYESYLKKTGHSDYPKIFRLTSSKGYRTSKVLIIARDDC